MTRYKYNITVHCTAQVKDEVLTYLRETLMPTWGKYPHWHTPMLAIVHSGEMEDMAAYAVQFDCDDLDALSAFDEMRDPILLDLMNAYPQRVMPFSILLEVVS